MADDLMERLGGDFRGVTIVLPSKRAGLFLNRYLTEMTDVPIWSPQYTTLNDLFHELSDLDVGDPSLLIFHLYAAYATVVESGGTGVVLESLDHFFSWGEVMLSDFDDIDNNLSHGRDIFKNLKALDDLTTFDYLSEHQQQAIERYFGYFDKDRKTKLKEKFLSIWNLLYPTYCIFRERLHSSGIAYEGMLRRDVVEHGIDMSRLPSAKYVFVGFNVLTTAEQRLLSALKEEGKALFYWDFDQSYMSYDESGRLSSLNSNTFNYFEAGRFIHDNISRFGSALPPDSDCYDNLKSAKKIAYVSSPTDTSQSRLVGQWLPNHINPNEDPIDTAIVLCDETMLQPLLHSIADDMAIPLNITMGYPLSQTPICSFLTSLTELQTYGVRGNGYWNYPQVSNVLRHPYSSLMSDGRSASILSDITRRHTVFVPESLFADVPFLQLVFTRQSSTSELLAYLVNVIEQLGIKSGNTPPNPESDALPSDSTSDFDRQLYEESIYIAYKTVNRLRIIHEEVQTSPSFAVIRSSEMSSERYVRLLKQLLRSQSVAFHGEPVEGVQIIGMLETRCLDFRNLIILGLNDTNLPKNIHKASFIPYTLREVHGMTTFEKQSSLYAYGFFRLLQRAEDVTLAYNSSFDGNSKGEMSRYMTQLLIEQDRLLGSKTKIERIAIDSRVVSNQPSSFSIVKSPYVMERLKRRYDIDHIENGPVNPHRYLSPSAINTYIDCPFKFYIQSVAGIHIDDDISEEVGNDIFGTIFHACMENIYKPYRGQTLTEDVLKRWSKDSGMIERMVDASFRKDYFCLDDDRPLHWNGEQLLNREVICRYVKKQLEFDSTLAPLIIEDVENDSHEMVIDTGTAKVWIGGIIDRIDTIFAGTDREVHRIVDYKTSSTAQKFNNLDELFDHNHKNRPYHILQTCYYSDIYSRDTDKRVSPSLMYIKPQKLERIDPMEGAVLVCDKYFISDFGEHYRDAFHEKLVGLVREIFDEEVPFVQRRKKCEWCKFKDFCI